MYRALIAALVVSALAGCTPRPEVEELLGPEPETTKYPRLIPLRQIPPPSPVPLEEAAEANLALQERAEELRRRAGGGAE